MIKLEMVASAGPWRKGQIVLVPDADHWLASSGYAKVVGYVEDSPSTDLGAGSTAPSGRRVARRSTRKVSDGSGSTESGGGSTVGSNGRASGSVDSGEPGVSGDAPNGTSQSGSSSRVG